LPPSPSTTLRHQKGTGTKLPSPSPDLPKLTIIDGYEGNEPQLQQFDIAVTARVGALIVAQFNAFEQEMGQQMGELSQQIGGLSQRIAGLEQQIGDLGSHLQQVDTSVNELDRRVARMEMDIVERLVEALCGQNVSIRS
jgi:uncharacterized protein (DUF3084 family)